MANDGLFPLVEGATVRGSNPIRAPRIDPLAPIEFIREQQAAGRVDFSDEQNAAALAAAEGDDEFSPDLPAENVGGSLDLVAPRVQLAKDPAPGRRLDPSAVARQEEEVARLDIPDQARMRFRRGNEQRRQRLGGRMPIEDAETGTRQTEGIAAVGDPTTAPGEQPETPEERDARARFAQTAKFFTTAAGATAGQAALFGAATAFSPAFRTSLSEWQNYKQKRDANALGRDRQEAAEGLVYPSLFRDHATAMRNMSNALASAGGMSARQVGQIMRSSATSLMDASVKAAQFVASERQRGIEDDTALGMQAAATINNALTQGVGFVDQFIQDLAVQQGRKAAGEALEQVAPQLNKIKDPEVRRRTWAAIQAAEERGDKQAVLDLFNRALATNPAGAATPATESAPEQGTTASATPPAGQTPAARRTPAAEVDLPPVPRFSPTDAEPRAEALSSDRELADHQIDTYQRTGGRYNTIAPDMPIEVDEFESVPPADPSTYPPNLRAFLADPNNQAKPNNGFEASTTTPGWSILELTDIGADSFNVRSYVRSPDGRIWGDEQVEEYIKETL